MTLYGNQLFRKQCYDDCYGLEQSYGHKCEVVPRIYIPIMKCSEKENFLKCLEQHRNPRNLTKCVKVRDYVDECVSSL
jgi:hypothetical protein